MKTIFSLPVGTGRSDQRLTMQRLKYLMKQVGDRDAVLRVNHDKSRADFTFYDVVDRQEMWNAPELANIDPDARWLLAEQYPEYKREKNETLKEWHARVDEFIQDKGYFVDDSGHAHWFYATEGATGGKKSLNFNTANYEGHDYRIYHVPVWAEQGDDSDDDDFQ